MYVPIPSCPQVLTQLMSLMESREENKQTKLDVGLKEPCALQFFFYFFLQALGEEQGRVWEFGALLLLPVLGGWAIVTHVANTEDQRILMPVSNKLAF